ncbi:hypothetical protein N8000_05330 [Rhodospirillales bacterium]|nr:hypothetical protein [Rhodospirillales bacterium]
MFNEDTGEDVVCLVCGADDDCGHIVADIDRTFSRCSGGEFLERDREFRELIKTAFMERAANKEHTAWSEYYLEELWQKSEVVDGMERHLIELHDNAFFDLLDELFLAEGAEKPDGSVIDEGGPGFTSAVSIYYGEEPKEIIDGAFDVLKKMLNAYS